MGITAENLANEFKISRAAQDEYALNSHKKAQKAIEAGVENIAFDRNGFLYHGRVKALAEAAREAGLKF